MDDEVTPDRRQDHGGRDRIEGHLEGLRGAVDNLAKVIGSMATKEDVAQSEARQDKRRRWAVGGIVAVLVLFVIPVVGQAFVLDEVQDIAIQNQANGTALVECTTPVEEAPVDEEGNPTTDGRHECYERQRANTAAILGQVNLALLDAAICARTEVTPEAIRECYAAAIETRTGTRPDF